jgi:hypothetical protein
MAEFKYGNVIALVDDRRLAADWIEIFIPGTITVNEL